MSLKSKHNHEVFIANDEAKQRLAGQILSANKIEYTRKPIKGKIDACSFWVDKKDFKTAQEVLRESF